jgi:hypothetical protein
MVLQNYVELKDGVPAKMHYLDHIIETRTITDPVSRRTEPRNVLVFTVDRLNDREVFAKFTTMAEKLASEFSPYLPDKSYRNFDFIITQRGEGYRRAWTVLRTPR